MARGPGRGGLKASGHGGKKGPGTAGIASPGNRGNAAQSYRGPGRSSAATLPGAGPGLVKTITGAVSGTGARIRITATAHGFDTGHQVTIAGVVGTVEANGTWSVLVITANTFELAGSTFVNAYGSGGTASRQ
jgi:hypothetical protein